MKFKHISKFKAVAIAAALLTCIVSCSGPLDMEFSSSLSHPQKERPEGATLKETPNLRRVFVLFSFGYNNLSYDLNEDIEEMIKGALPEYGLDKNVVLVLRHGTAKNSNYSLPSSPVLTTCCKGVNPEQDMLQEPEDLREGNMFQDLLLPLTESVL